MLLVPRKRIWTQQPQQPVALADEFFKDSALCYLLNSRGPVRNLAERNKGRILQPASPNLVSTRHGLGVGCADSTRSFLDPSFYSPIATSNGVGTGAFTLLLTAGLSYSANRSFIFHTRYNSTGYFSLFVLANGKYTEGGSSSINEPGTLWVGSLDVTAYSARGIVLPGFLTSTPKKLSILFSRAEDGSREVWINGELVAIETTGFLNDIGANRNQLLSIGGNNTASGFSSADPVSLAYVSNTKFSSERSRRVTENPWQIFEAPDSRIFVPVSLGGGSSLAAAASGSNTASGSANLAAQVGLGAVGVSLASGSASASVAVPLSAAGITVAGGSANGTATVTISAAGLAQAAGQAGLSAEILLQAAGAAQAAGNAALSAQLSALASGAAQASGSANLSGGAPGALSAVGSATAGGAAALKVTVQLVATGGAQASGSATGTSGAPGAISAVGAAQAGGSGTASVAVALTAAGFVQAMGAGTFTIEAPMSAIGSAFASGLAAGSVIAGSSAITWPLPSNVLTGISYGPTGTEYIGTLIPGSGTSITVSEIADEIMLRLNTTPIEVTALNIPTVTQTADAVWAKVLP